MIDSRTKFRPVYGPEDAIMTLPHNEGYVYFAKDSGKIYLDADDDRIPVGGSGVSLYYATQAEVPQDEDGNGFYIINKDSITEEGVTLKVDDLIINSDGAFYRIFLIDDNNGTYVCTRMAISGSGGGGGGGGGGFTNDLTVVVDSDTLVSSQTLIQGKDHYVSVTATSLTDPYVTLSFDFTGVGGYQESRVVRAESGEPYNLNLNFLPINSGITMIVTATADNSTMTTNPFKRVSGIKVVEMSIKKVSEDTYLPAINTGESYRLTLNYIPVGSRGISEVLHVYIDNTENFELSKTIGEDEYNKNRSITIPHLSHGVHKIDLSVSAQVGNNNLESNKISFEAAWVDPEEDTPVIWVGTYDSTVINYENASIPFMVYNPVDVQNQRKSSVLLFKNGMQISELQVEYSTSGWEFWDITAIYEVGVNHLSIQNGLASKSIDVTVTTVGSRDLGLVEEYSLMKNFTAAGRSSSELLSTRNTWKSVTDLGRSDAILEGFNWANNGWVSPAPGSSDYKNGSYLSVANGAKVTIPMDTITLNQAAHRNYSFEVRFRVKNVQKYSTLVTTIPTYFYIDGEGNEHKSETDGLTLAEIERLGYTVLYDQYGSPWMNDAKVLQETNITTGVLCKWLNNNGEGFVIGTQEAFFQSPQKLVSVRYKEDEVINIGFVVSADDSLVYIYLNGILSGATTLAPLSSASPSFSITSDLVFNSDYCDVDLYRIRVYTTGLTMPQVIHNYLSDLHDIEKYDQNQLTMATNDYALSYEKLVEYNENHPDKPTMPYATWKITTLDDQSRETLPYYKGDKRAVTCTFVNVPLDRALDTEEIDEWYYYTHCPSFSAQKIDIDVQGTSSQGYPRRNYKLKYKKAKNWKFTHGPLAGCLINQKWYFDKTTNKAIDPALVDINILVPPIEGKGEDESDEAYAARETEYKNAVKAEETRLAGLYKVLTPNFHMDNEELGTNKFTWKIDYMESSGTYNTGFANLMGNLVHPLYMKHPLEDQGINASTMRTSVYGFPLLVFHEYDNPAGNPTESGAKYEYIGRYNMNLDKSSNEYYGFESSNTNVATGKTIKKIAESWELSDNQGNWCSWRFPSAAARETGFGTMQDGYTDRLEMMQHFEYRYSAYGDQIDAIGAKGKYDGTTTDEAIIAEIGTTNEQKNHFVRQRYYNLERLFYWLDSTDTEGVVGELQDIVIREPKLDKTTGEVTIEKTYPEYVEYNTSKSYDGKDGATSTPAVGGGYTTRFTKDSVDYRREKFRNEFDLHLDKHYCCVYFIMTELLLCYDSRGKNMMMSSWGPHEEGGEFIWYPIFYDIDTQLGLNNSGAYLWDYDADVTKDGLFSTPGSVLWKNLYDLFYDDIVNTYRILRGLKADDSTDKITNSLTYANITGAYECNGDVFNSYAMKGLRPVIAIGLDEYYKYFATTAASGVGFFDTTGKLIKEGSPSFAYCCQGDKILTTELLLRNRLNYIDSWWIGGDYQIEQIKGSTTWMRVSGNRAGETSDKYLNLPQAEIDARYNAGDNSYKNVKAGTYPVKYFDSVPGYKMKPFLKQYIFYYTDEQAGENTKYNDNADEQEGVWTKVPSDKEGSYKTDINSPNSQLCYIPGMNYLSSLGDLSISYIDELHLKQGLRLLDITLGSDVPGYYNELIVPSKFDLNDSLNDMETNNHKPLLQKVVLTGLTKLAASLDLAASSKLQEFRALDTPITSVSFAKGAPLHTIHLPSSITALALVEATDLDHLITSKPVIGTLEGDVNNPDAGLNFVKNNPSTYRGLYIEGVTDLSVVGTQGHKLTSVTIQGGNLGYESYTLLNNLVRIKEAATTNDLLKVNFTDVKWTPYSVVPYGELQDGMVTYYQLTDHSTYIPYTGSDPEEWASLTLNEKIFTYDSSAQIGKITSLALLNKFITDFESATNLAQQHFINTAGNNTKSVPAITGEIYINNTDSTAINETDINAIYKRYWPDLKVCAKFVNEAYIAKYVQRLDNGKDHEIEIYRYNKGEDVHPQMLPERQNPAKLNYDFRGWTLDPQYCIVASQDVDRLKATGKILEQSSIEALTFSDANSIITLYAVFSVTSYNINFLNPDDSLIYTERVNYGTYLTEPALLPWTSQEEELADDQRYKFLGWTTDKANCFPRNEKSAKLTDITKIMSQNQDRNFYAVYISESVETATDEKYFQFRNANWQNPKTGQSYTGVEIRPAVGAILQGKITLPTKDSTDKKVISIAGFDHQPMTHVYWAGTPELVRINAEAFAECNNLKKFTLPNTVQIVGEKAFWKDSLLEYHDYSQTQVYEIGQYAYNMAGMATPTGSLDTLHLPGSLQTVGQFGMGYLTNAPTVNILQFGGPGDPTNARMMGQYAIWLQEDQVYRFNTVIFYVTSDQNRDVLLNLANGFIGITPTCEIQFIDA